MTTDDRTRAIAWFEKQAKCLAMPGAAKIFGLAAEALNALDAESEPLTHCRDCAKYQTQSCSAKHEQALIDFCSHGVRRPTRKDDEA